MLVNRCMVNVMMFDVLDLVLHPMYCVDKEQSRHGTTGTFVKQYSMECREVHAFARAHHHRPWFWYKFEKPATCMSCQRRRGGRQEQEEEGVQERGELSFGKVVALYLFAV